MISQSSQDAGLTAQRDHLTFSRLTGADRSWQLAALFFALLSFLEVSRILDVLHLPLIPIVVGLLAVSLILSKRILTFWRSGAGRVLPLFIGWIVLAYLQSPHTELSTFYVLNCVQGSLLFLAAAGLLSTTNDLQKFFRLLTIAGLILCALGLVWTGTVNGRFALRNGPYTDPNTFAMALLALAPIIWVSFAIKPWWIRLCGLFATALPLLLMFRTVSRGGFVGILAMLVVLFFLSSVRIKVVLASVTVLATIVVVAFLPDSMRTRLASATRISSVVGERSPQNADAVSVDSRETMFSTSINVSLTYPLLGVGPGNFGPTIAEFGRIQNQNWINLNTHNAYTQISSETGFPGLLLFLLVIGFSVKSLIQTFRLTAPRGTFPNPEVHRLSAALLISLAATCTCMFFLSEGYSMLNFLWFGLANGLRRLLPDDPEDEEEEFVEVEADRSLD